MAAPFDLRIHSIGEARSGDFGDGANVGERDACAARSGVIVEPLRTCIAGTVDIALRVSIVLPIRRSVYVREELVSAFDHRRASPHRGLLVPTAQRVIRRVTRSRADGPLARNVSAPNTQRRLERKAVSVGGGRWKREAEGIDVRLTV